MRAAMKAQQYGVEAGITATFSGVNEEQKRNSDARIPMVQINDEAIAM